MVLAAAAPAGAAPKPSRACDFFDKSVCLQPWPNDYFMKHGRIAIKRKAMPADKDGKHIDPAAWKRNDGFSPGQTILTHVRGLDNDKAFRRNLRKIPGVLSFGRYFDEMTADSEGAE